MPTHYLFTPIPVGWGKDGGTASKGSSASKAFHATYGASLALFDLHPGGVDTFRGVEPPQSRPGIYQRSRPAPPGRLAESTMRRSLRANRGLGLRLGVEPRRLHAGHLVGLSLVERLALEQRASQRFESPPLAL